MFGDKGFSIFLFASALLTIASVVLETTDVLGGDVKGRDSTQSELVFSRPGSVMTTSMALLLLLLLFCFL